MRIVPISAEQSPLLILDLILKLKVRDVMTAPVITVAPSAPMHAAAALMKRHSITGLPVVDPPRLMGIVSMQDIIQALECRQMDDPVEAHMTRGAVTLEDDMPISLALSCFGKYSFGRFPVLDRTGHLAGIVTSRDINITLFTEVVKELTRQENAGAAQPDYAALHGRKVYPLKQHGFDLAGKASQDIKANIQRRNLPPPLIRRIAIAAYELEINLIIHSLGGTLTCVAEPDRVEIIANDSGPGIPDVNQALLEGYTTASPWIKSLGFGAGMGLPNVKRVSDEFHIQSIMGAGTTVKAVIRLPSEGAQATGAQP